jgi:hypothetical protein
MLTAATGGTTMGRRVVPSAGRCVVDLASNLTRTAERYAGRVAISLGETVTTSRDLHLSTGGIIERETFGPPGSGES